jgi:hypothetical protein
MTQQRPCSERRHMTPEEFGIWTYARMVSFTSGIFYASRRKTAQQFADTTKTTIQRLTQSLLEKGWLEKMDTPARDGDGNYVCKRYKVLTHEQWVKNHPGKCPDFRTGNKSSEQAAVPISGPACPDSRAHLSQFQDAPVLISGPSIRRNIERNFEEPSFEEKKQVAQKNGLSLEDYQDIFDDEPVFQPIQPAKIQPQGDWVAERNKQKKALLQLMAGRGK